MLNKNKNLNNDLSEFLVMQDETPNTLKYYRQIIPITLHHFYIIDEIGEVGQYLELIHTLKTAEAHDTIFIYLNTPGGNLRTTIQLMSAMKQTNGTIVTCLEGEVCSAGTMLFLAGHKFLVNPNCSFMIHNYSGGILGKGQEIAAQAKFVESYIKTLYTDVYAEFLDADEIKNVLDGKDIWLTSDEVIERLGNKVRDTDELDVNKLVSKLPTLIEQLIRDIRPEEDEVEEVAPKPVKSKAAPKKKVTPKKKPK